MSMRRTVKIFLMLSAFLFVLTSCAYTQTDMIDFVQYADIQYVRNYENEIEGSPITEDDLDREYFVVKRKVSETMNSLGHVSKDNDATNLDVGTQIYTVKGYDPDFRVAAFYDGDILLYEAYTNKWADRGLELLDIKDKVECISVIENKADGPERLADIDDELLVKKLVDMILEAPIEYKEGNSDREEYYYLGFQLKDGTIMSRHYDIGEGILAKTIRLPEEFREIIEQKCKK